MTLIAKHEIGNLYGATAVYVRAFHILFIVPSAHRCKYKLAAALLGRPRQETFENGDSDIGQRKRLFVEGAPKL